MNDCGAKSKLSGPLIISQKPGTTVIRNDLVKFLTLQPVVNKPSSSLTALPASSWI
jgi:hypothetical protein